MELLSFLMICGVAGAIGHVLRDRAVSGTQVSLCLACTNAVITRGTSGQQTIACNYGGAMRPMKFVVCECTGYGNKGNTPTLVKIAGFVREERDIYEEVAIS